MGTAQHTQTFTAQYRVCWFVFFIETDRLAERGKPGNYILHSVLVVNFLLTKDGPENTETKYKPIYIVSDLNHPASSSYVYMNQCCGWEIIYIHPTRICVLCLVKSMFLFWKYLWIILQVQLPWFSDSVIYLFFHLATQLLQCFLGFSFKLRILLHMIHILKRRRI